MTIDLIVYTAITCVLTIEIAFGANHNIVRLVWDLYCLVLTLAICKALNLIRSYMKEMKLNAYASKRLILLH